MLNGSIEDNTLTLICHHAGLAGKVIERIEASGLFNSPHEAFSTPTYQLIAREAIKFHEQSRSPIGVHLIDALEQEIKTGPNGRFMLEVLGEIERLGPLVDADHVYRELDTFLVKQKQSNLINKASDILIEDRPDAEVKVSMLGWEIANTRADETMLADPWGEPEPPPFDTGILPKVLRDLVNERGKAMGVDPAGLFWSAISCCSAALDGSIRLQMGQDQYYTVPPGIWVLLFGYPSIGRTPILDTAWAPLRRIDVAASKAHAAAHKAWNAAPKEDRGPEPMQTHYIADDITPEKLGDILAQQDRGVARFFDEWPSFAGQFDRYSHKNNGAARSMYVECYDGKAGNINRMGRGFSYSNNKHIVPCGGVQPDVLRNYPDLTNDGLLQRFIPIILRAKMRGEDEPAGREAEYYSQLIEEFTEIPGKRTIPLSPEARRIRTELDDELQRWITNDSLGRGFMTFVGKLLGLWGRLTLNLGCILHLQDNAGMVGRHGPETIGGEAAEIAAILIVEQVLPHGASLYNWLGGGGNRADTQAIAGWLLAHQRARIVASDLTSNVQACRGLGAPKIAEMVSPLVTMGWLVPEDGYAQRQPTKWKVVQRIYTQFPEKAARENYQRAEITALINSRRTAPVGKDNTQQPATDTAADTDTATSASTATSPPSEQEMVERRNRHV